MQEDLATFLGYYVLRGQALLEIPQKPLETSLLIPPQLGDLEWQMTHVVSTIKAAKGVRVLKEILSY